MSITPPSLPSSASRLLLIGAGHAHLHLVSQRQRFGDTQVLLVDPGGFWYSALAGSVLSGRLPAARDRIDPVRLARRHGVIPIRARLTGIDLSGRRVILEDGRQIDFTHLSLNLGSSVLSPAVRVPGPSVWTVKPLTCMVALHHRLTGAFRRGEHPRVIVVGGGPSGIEVANNLYSLCCRHAGQCRITLVTRASALIPDAPPNARRWLERLMARRGIRVITNTSVTGQLANGAMLNSDESTPGEDSLTLVEADHVIYASGLSPPGVIQRLGLPIFPGRGIAVNDMLQSPADPDIFAVGDCAAMVNHHLPHLGVYGVRQAPVLLDNLVARLMGRTLRPYVPQSRALAILDLGEGLGMAIRGRHWWAGRSALWWKHWLDQRFLARYR